MNMRKDLTGPGTANQHFQLTSKQITGTNEER
jgi:hypothetical protein